MKRPLVFLGAATAAAVFAFQIVLIVGLGGGTIGSRCEAAPQRFGGLGPAVAHADEKMPTVDGYTEKQLKVAATITTVAKDEKIPESGWVIGVGVALQESALGASKGVNKPNPDGDAGAFQQRQLPGWYGTLKEVTNDTYAARTFYTGKDIVTDGLTEAELNAAAGGPGYHIPGLKDIDGWEDMSLTEAAQAVQRSADGSWYEKQWPDAKKIVEAVEDVEIDLDDPAAGDDDDEDTMDCGGDGGGDSGGGGGSGDYPKGWREPGKWGGYDNGKIPDKELCAAPWQKDEKQRCDAMDKFTELNKKFKKEFGHDISITDGYRTYEEQVATKKAKGNMAAEPGTSKHGWALAMDLGSNINSYTSKEHKWMRDNAGEFGWILPEWAQQGGSLPEPWHWEYWGIKGEGDDKK